MESTGTYKHDAPARYHLHITVSTTPRHTHPFQLHNLEDCQSFSIATYQIPDPVLHTDDGRQ